jgi:uncharacterized protein YyaL (SSP411 family)
MPNALALQTSPYLRQHASNPVDWLPWGPEALTAARERDVPLLVSIGYSSCHWCHVMEHESFEDPRVAALMNEELVCVKVDREERPDIDALYMEAVQGMTGHGGWPLNVFLTPEQLPFYGGTYFPPEPRQGMPSWTQVLHAIAETWREQAAEIRAGGERIRAQLAAGAGLSPSAEPFDAGALDAAVGRLRESFDQVNGGFASPPSYAPKFPQTSVIELLLRHGEREMSLATLRAMAGGGIHDQLGGGFHRYTVDATWTVPHFEKMLYDNALLARAYLHAHRLVDGDGNREGGDGAGGEDQANGASERDAGDGNREGGDGAGGEDRASGASERDAELGGVCRATLEWALREMRGPEGGFYSALDADSEGVEGRYYVWRAAELRELLGEDADAAIRWLGVSEEGNFVDPHHPEPGLNVLTDRSPAPMPDPATRERIRARLLEARTARTRPGLDDKRLTSWNALMVAALADAGAVLGGPDGLRYLEAAERCAEFILSELRDGEGRLLRTYSEGGARIGGYLEDHAFLLEALIVLFEATCEERWLTEARALAEQTIDRFADSEKGGFFSTPADGEALIARRKDLEDNPIPSGASSAALGLLRLAQITGEERYERHALGVLRLLHEIAPRHPMSFGHLLQALQLHLSPAEGLACAIPPAPRSAPSSQRPIGSHPSWSATATPPAAAPLGAEAIPTKSRDSGRAPTGRPARGSPPTPGA